MRDTGKFLVDLDVFLVLGGGGGVIAQTENFLGGERIVTGVLHALAGGDLGLNGRLAAREALQVIEQAVGKAIVGNTHGSAYISIMVASISSVMLMSLAEAWKAFWNMTRLVISSSR